MQWAERRAGAASGRDDAWIRAVGEGSMQRLLGGRVLTIGAHPASIALGMGLALPHLAVVATRAATSCCVDAGLTLHTFFRGTPSLLGTGYSSFYSGHRQFGLGSARVGWPLLRESWSCAIIASRSTPHAYTAESPGAQSGVAARRVEAATMAIACRLLGSA